MKVHPVTSAKRSLTPLRCWSRAQSDTLDIFWFLNKKEPNKKKMRCFVAAGRVQSNCSRSPDSITRAHAVDSTRMSAKAAKSKER